MKHYYYYETQSSFKPQRSADFIRAIHAASPVDTSIAQFCSTNLIVEFAELSNICVVWRVG